MKPIVKFLLRFKRSIHNKIEHNELKSKAQIDKIRLFIENPPIEI